MKEPLHWSKHNRSNAIIRADVERFVATGERFILVDIDDEVFIELSPDQAAELADSLKRALADYLK